MDSTSNPRLSSAVTLVLASASVGQAIDLNDFQVNDFQEEDDRAVVKQAVKEGRNSMVPFQILTNSLCVNAGQTAEARVQELFTEATGLMEVVLTPPVGREETICATSDN